MEYSPTRELPLRFQFASLSYPAEEQLPQVLQHELDSLWKDFGVIIRFSPIEFDPPYSNVPYELHIGEGIWFDSYDERDIISAIAWIRSELVKII